MKDDPYRTGPVPGAPAGHARQTVTPQTVARRTLTGVAVAMLAAAAVLGGGADAPARACTRIFWNDNDQARVVARTMDLFRPDEARLQVSPRGVSRSSAAPAGPAAQWTAKYGALVVTAFGVAVSEGLNEKGLSASLLYLSGSQYEPRDGRPGLPNGVWAQYVVDNFATVAEALEGLKGVQVVAAEVAGRTWPLHLALADRSGDSAVIEYVDGRMVVHHGRQYTVMTNEPPLDWQLQNLKRYRTFGGDLAMPGDIDPASRFVRAASYLTMLPKPAATVDALAGAMALARNVAVPPGARDTSGQEDITDLWPTLWISLSDTTHDVFYFAPVRGPEVIWADLNRLDFRPGAPQKSVDAYDPTLSGDITTRLLP